MKLRNIVSRISFIHFFIPILLLQMDLSAQPVNPQPGENIWHLMAQVGTEVDQLALMQNSCCVGTFTALNIIESKIDAIVINSSCDLSGTYTLLNTAIAQEATTQSKLDECCFDLSSKIDTIQVNSTCDLLGTYTLLNTAIAQEFTTQSKLDLCCATINSKVDSLTNIVNADFAGTFSAIAAIPAANFTGTYTLLNTAIAQEFTTQSKLDLCCSTINSKVDSLTNIVNADFAGTFSAIAAIPAANFTGTYTLLNTAIAQEFTTQSKLDLCCSTINSKVDSLTNIVNADFAGTFSAIAAIPAANFTGTYTLLNTAITQEFTTQSKLDLCCSTINSKVDSLTNIVNADFAGTFSAIAAIPAANFTGTYTLLNAAIAQEFTTQSKLDLCCSTINSKIDSLSGIVVADFAATFTVLANIRQEETTIESKVDALTNMVNADFAGTFTAIKAISGGSCDLSGTYTVLNALGLCNARPLTVPSTGTTITAAGVYCLTGNVTLQGTSSIAINASNVVLDLNNHTVSMSNSTSQTCISVSVLVNSVTVKNGYISGTSAVGSIGISSSIQFLNIQDLTISNCSFGLFVSGSDVSIDNVITQDCTSVGIFVNSGNLVNVSNCQMFGGNIGIHALFAIGANSIRNCIANGPLTGFDISSQLGSVAVESCTALGAANTGFVGNVASNTPANINFDTCIANACATGFNIGASGNQNGSYALQNCQALNCSGGYVLLLPSGSVTDCSAVQTAGSGFVLASSANTLLKNCESIGSSNISFDMSNTTSCSVENCTAQMSVTGFNLNGASGCSVRNSNALNNITNGFDASTAGVCCVIGDSVANDNTNFGFTGNANVSFYNNVANCNGTNFDDFSASSAASGMLDSKVDALTNIVNTDFSGTFTAIKAISGGSCDLSGTYTAINSLGLCNAIPLTVPSTGIVISSPGVYCVTNDVNLGTNNILISASNVVLDLNQKTITGSSTGGIVQLGAGFCTIQNGTLVDGTFAATGISASGVVDNIIINNVKIINTANGINFPTGCSNSIFIDIFVDGFSNNGININDSVGGSSNYLTFDNCLVYGTGTAAITISDSSTIGCRGLTFNNCIADAQTQAFAITGYEASYYNCLALRGLFLHSNSAVTGLNVLFDSCNAKNRSIVTILNSSDTVGSVIYNNCSATESTGAGSALSIVNALKFTISGCTAVGGNIGFSGCSNGVVVNSTSSNSIYHGFYMQDCTSCILRGCTAVKPTAVGGGIGVWLINCTACTVAECSVSSASFQGFQDVTGTGNIFYSNAATSCPTSYSGITSPPSAPKSLFAAATYGANLYDVNP